jgi:DNA-binding NarL/FixJ family response regulator
MPRCDGVEATRRVRAEHPETQVVVLTTYADDDSLFPALQAGARGYLTKDAGGEEIEKAIADVMAGDAGLSPSVQRRLLERLSQAASPTATPPTATPAAPAWSGTSTAPAGPVASMGERRRARDLPDGLTAREAEVLGLVADGLSNAEIAERLYVSPATVKTHINNLFAKTGARDRAQAVRYAFEHGLAKP